MIEGLLDLVCCSTTRCGDCTERGCQDTYFALVSFPSLDVVPSQKELYEEKKVASVHKEGSSTDGGRGEAFLVSHVKDRRHSQGHSHHHLQDLQRGYYHSPPRTNLDCHKKVVKVHHGMDAIVEIPKEESSWSLRNVTMPCVQ